MNADRLDYWVNRFRGVTLSRGIVSDLLHDFATEIERAGWQPIETAPRDGTRILLYRPLAEKTNDDPVDIKRGVPRNGHCWEETIPPGMDATNYTDGACKATHWMPLPPEPSNA